MKGAAGKGLPTTTSSTTASFISSFRRPAAAFSGPIAHARSRDCGLVVLRGLLRPFVQLLGFGIVDAFALALDVKLRYRKLSLNAPVRLTNNSRKPLDTPSGH